MHKGVSLKDYLRYVLLEALIYNAGLCKSTFFADTHFVSLSLIDRLTDKYLFAYITANSAGPQKDKIILECFL